MKRMFAIVLLFVCLLAACSASAANFFNLREGIEWYMSEEQVMKCLKKEANFDDYEIIDGYEQAKEGIYASIPWERDNRQIWIIKVENISLGKADEKVSLVLSGTQKTGLYDLIYYVKPDDENEDATYNRAKDLKAQLEKKYGKFKTTDKWKNRKKAKINDRLYFCTGQANKPSGRESDIVKRAMKSEGITNILLMIHKKTEDTYQLAVEYQCPRKDEIEASMLDGSLYTSTAYGL